MEVFGYLVSGRRWAVFTLSVFKTKDMIHVNSADKKPERLNSFCVTVAH